MSGHDKSGIDKYSKLHSKSDYIKHEWHDNDMKFQDQLCKDKQGQEKFHGMAGHCNTMIMARDGEDNELRVEAHTKYMNITCAFDNGA